MYMYLFDKKFQFFTDLTMKIPLRSQDSFPPEGDHPTDFLLPRPHRQEDLLGLRSQHLN